MLTQRLPHNKCDIHEKKNELCLFRKIICVKFLNESSLHIWTLSAENSEHSYILTFCSSASTVIDRNISTIVSSK